MQHVYCIITMTENNEFANWAELFPAVKTIEGGLPVLYFFDRARDNTIPDRFYKINCKETHRDGGGDYIISVEKENWLNSKGSEFNDNRIQFLHDISIINPEIYSELQNSWYTWHD